jgi:hypothetical protein
LKRSRVAREGWRDDSDDPSSLIALQDRRLRNSVKDEMGGKETLNRNSQVEKPRGVREKAAENYQRPKENEGKKAKGSRGRARAEEKRSG